MKAKNSILIISRMAIFKNSEERRKWEEEVSTHWKEKKLVFVYNLENSEQLPSPGGALIVKDKDINLFGRPKNEEHWAVLKKSYDMVWVVGKTTKKFTKFCNKYVEGFRVGSNSSDSLWVDIKLNLKSGVMNQLTNFTFRTLENFQLI